jgi:hypothetical protein
MECRADMEPIGITGACLAREQEQKVWGWPSGVVDIQVHGPKPKTLRLALEASGREACAGWLVIRQYCTVMRKAASQARRRMLMRCTCAMEHSRRLMAPFE